MLVRFPGTMPAGTPSRAPFPWVMLRFRNVLFNPISFSPMKPTVRLHASTGMLSRVNAVC